MTDAIQATLTRSRVVLHEATLQLHEAGDASAAAIADLLAAGVPMRRILNLYPHQLHEWQVGYVSALERPGVLAILDRRSWNLTRSLARYLPATTALGQQDSAAYTEIRLRTVLGEIGTPTHLHFLMMTAHVLATSPTAIEVLQDSHALGHAKVLLNTLEGVLQAGFQQAHTA